MRPAESSPITSTTAAVAATATVVAVAVPLIEKIVGELTEKYYDYSNAKMLEIKQLRELYRDHCQKLENQGGLTTRFQGLEGDGENKDFPIYFQMDPEREKQPMFFKKKFQTIMESERWIRFVGDSYLNAIPGGIQDMIGSICNYQNERNKGRVAITENIGIGGKGYYYDPTNLFCEEFKRWLVELSKAPLDEKTLLVVEGRMSYLRKIDVDEVFKQSRRQVTRRELAIDLHDKLKYTIHPMIKSTIAARGSREHYNALNKNISALMRQIAKFCFYVFRDTEGTPVDFILEQIEKSSGNYKAILTETRTGRLLQKLHNCPLYKLTQEAQQAERPSGSLLKFSGKMDLLLEAGAKEYEKLPWGILPEFQKRSTLDPFYNLHALMEQLCVFQKISKDLYVLSGEGGNILVYGFLSPQTQKAMGRYCMLLGELEVTIKALHRIADENRHRLIRSKDRKSASEERWIRLFRYADEAYEAICNPWISVTDKSDERFSLIGASLRLVKEIEIKMAIVNTSEYQKQLQQDIDKFSRWMTLFSDPGVLASPRVSRMESAVQSRVEVEAVEPSKNNSSKGQKWFRRLSGPTEGPKLFNFRRKSENAVKIAEEITRPAGSKAAELIPMPCPEPKAVEVIPIARTESKVVEVGVIPRAESPVLAKSVVEKPEAEIFREAQLCYQASQNLQLKREEWNQSLDKAISIIDSLLTRQARHPEYLFLRAKCLVDKRDSKNRSQALAEYSVALAYCPPENLDLRCRILLERGKTHVFLNRLEEAIRDYDEVLTLDANRDEVRIRKANIYIYSEKKEYEQGIAELGFIIDKFVGGELLIEALKSRANVAMLSENYRLAYEDYERLTALLPDDSNIECKRDQAQAKLGSQANLRGK